MSTQNNNNLKVFQLNAILLFAVLIATGCRSSIHSANIGDNKNTDQTIPLGKDYTQDHGIVPLAFPGADGAGRYTTGGRGGVVIKVTNLNDSGPGSLRAALRQHGPRIVVFEVSGYIEAQSQLVVNNNDITIAGQSAPGHGIGIKNHGFRINADNVIIRYMRFRPGDSSGTELDAFTAVGQKNIIIDHCSMSWSTDETASMYDNENTTLQWCLISESLHNSVHSKGAHGYGGIWGGINASFINNVLAHHTSRNPRLQGERYQDVKGLERAELVNNIIYNWGNKAIYGGEEGRYNIINNIFIPGPATRSSSRGEILETYDPAGTFYLSGNLLIENNTPVTTTQINVSTEEETDDALTDNPFTISNAATPQPAMDMYDIILEDAGASYRRDALDQRIIEDVRNRSYTYGRFGIIDSPADTEGWPQLATAPPPPDTDNDGIPDEWEQLMGLNPNDPADNSAHTLHTHYTNIEVYLNGLVE
jgi:hypothetical protein